MSTSEELLMCLVFSAVQIKKHFKSLCSLAIQRERKAVVSEFDSDFVPLTLTLGMTLV